MEKSYVKTWGGALVDWFLASRWLYSYKMLEFAYISND